MSSSDLTWLRELTSALTTAAEVDVTVAVAAAAALTREVLGVALAAGRPPGVYRLDDVLLEYQLSRPSEARGRLSGLLDPLEGNPELVDTLTCYFRLGGRRPTAAALHVHPNTVDYRLRRIHALTGLDATKATDVSLLRAALAAHRLGSS